ncbi:MAG: TIGR00341 family protein [Deltaproteobacteria bacterium]|nr:MAG: TIGR00341 family protein [Deltaproteobacteria bacterium]
MKKVIIRARRQDFPKVKGVVKELSYLSYVDESERRVTIYVPEGELDQLIERVYTCLDKRYRENVIEVTSLDFIISPVLERAERKGAGKAPKAPVERLIDSTRPYTHLDLSKTMLTSIAGLIALIGFFLNNPVIVIGAMLLSPILGPIHSFSVNIAVGRIEDAIKSVTILLSLLTSVVFLSLVSTYIVNFVLPLAPTREMLGRAEPNPIYVLMAVMLGFASVLAMERGLPEVIAGVAIAAALLPPAVDTGLLLVLSFDAAMGPAIITLQNLIGLMAGSLMAVIALRIGPRKYYEKATAKRFLLRSLLVIFVLLALITLISFVFM